MARDIFLDSKNSWTQSPFALANQEIPPDPYFHRMEDQCILGLPWSMHMQNSKLICGIGYYVELSRPHLSYQPKLL
jgi:hypothetical protein